MKRISLGATGAILAAAGGLVIHGGHTLIAAQSANPNSVRVRSSAVRTGPRTAVRVKPVGGPVKQGSLVVPLKPRGATSGELIAVNKAGKPLGNCPLKRTDVAGDIAGFVARVTVTQKYSNPYREPIEAVYTFPLPEDAAVDAMEMRIGERVIQGAIKRREEARQIYEQAKQQGMAASLLDQERPNIFTQAVANIMPGQDVTITIKYVNTLKYDEGRYTFAFPMVVGPRFVPAGGYAKPGERGKPSPSKTAPANPGATSVVTDAHKITPPITPPGTRAGHDITVRVNLDTGLILDDIGSVSHAIDVVKEGEGKALVALVNEATIPNKDFILRYTVAGPQMQTGVISTSDGVDGYFTLVLQPPAAPKPAQIAPKEMVFVLDQTGSQMGEPIAKSKETMKYAIQRLNPNDTFQLLGFTTEVYPCFPQAVPATPENIRKAVAWMEPLSGAGGTDILKASDFALKMPDDPKRLRIICFMTDGYVGNDMQILDYIGKNRGRARMFPFGIGSSVNRFLIEGMAREGRGQAEFVTLSENGAEAAERFYRRIQNPVLLDPQVDWHGLPVEDVYPQHIPDVFSDGPIIVKGRFTRPAEGDITVRGILGGKPWEQQVRVEFTGSDGRNAGLESLWARARLDDLQAQDWLGAQTGQPNPGIKEQIVQTALEHRLMSQYTSFVAVERKVVNQGGVQRTVDVPVEMPEGVSYEGIFGMERQEVFFDSSLAPAASTALGLYSTRAKSSNFAFSPGRAPATVNAPALAAPPPPPGPGVAGGTLLARRSMTLADELEMAQTTDPLSLGLSIGDKDALARLETLTPADRLETLRRAKLDLSLHDLAAAVKAKGKNGSLNIEGRPAVTNGRVRIEIAVNAWPPDLAARLKALGFTQQKREGVVLTGTIAVAKLDALIEEVWVAEVTPA